MDHSGRHRIEEIGLFVARAAFVGAVFALPISTAGANTCVALACIGWLFSGRVFDAIRIVRQEPAAALAITLLGMLALSSLWSPAPVAEQWFAISKFRKLLLVPIVASLFDDEAWRTHVLRGLLTAMLITLFFSLLSSLTGQAPPFGNKHWYLGNYVTFKQHITHNWFMSLFAFGCLVATRFVRERPHRWALAVLAGVSILDIFALVPGRTGHFTMIALLMLWFVLRFGRKGLLIGVISIAIGAVPLLLTDNAFKSRAELSVAELSDASAGHMDATSGAIRLIFWRNGLTLLAQHPLIGHGLGSTHTVYEPLTRGKTGAEAYAPPNPHNEFLNIGIQSGVVGMALLVAMLVMLVRAARRTQGMTRWLAIGMVFMTAVGGLVNSTIWDFSEGVAVCIFFGWIIAAARSPARGPGTQT